MQRLVKKKRRLITRPDVGSYWISFSDMLSSLLLVFILAVFFSIYQYFSLLDIKTRELNEQRAELDRTQVVLAQKEKDLETAQVTLMGKEEEVASIQIQLQKQEADLNAAQAALKLKEEEQAALHLQLLSQQEALSSQQKQIDELLGVRTDIIRELSQSFAANNIAVKVNTTTGDIVLDSQLMFETGSDLISAAGQAELAKLIPVYLSVLLRPEYKAYVAEVTVVGHTDSKGSYLFNLELSQNRALQVATYCLQMPQLSSEQRSLLQEIITAKGRSFSDRIFNADGTENMAASRRVEIQFRLKDSEMIQKMNDILKAQ